MRRYIYTPDDLKIEIESSIGESISDETVDTIMDLIDLMDYDIFWDEESCTYGFSDKWREYDDLISIPKELNLCEVIDVILQFCLDRYNDGVDGTEEDLKTVHEIRMMFN